MQEICDDDTFTMQQAFDYFAYNIESNGCGKYSPLLCNDNFEWCVVKIANKYSNQSISIKSIVSILNAFRYGLKNQKKTIGKS